VLARYQMKRGVPKSKLPKGRRIDIRMHTHHVLRPPKQVVTTYLAAPSARAWATFRRDYRAEIARRFAKERPAFDALAALARTEDVYLGCSCPTATNPDVHHCHTWLALEFMHEHYPDLDVRFPS
jgi:uncharacterized protein YeaO (DUF488 family)